MSAAPPTLNPARKGRTLVPTRQGGSAGCAPVTGRGEPSVLLALAAPGGSGLRAPGSPSEPGSFCPELGACLTATLDPEEAIELGLSLCRAGELADAERVLLEREVDADEE